MAMDFRGTNHVPGIRNNNPGNLIEDGTSWQGKAGSDGHFVIFKDMAYGVRAALLNYHAQISIHHLGTIAAYVAKYAPPTENDTAAYLAAIETATGLVDGSPLPTDADTVRKILMVHFLQENGPDAALISDADIQAGFDLANSSLSGFFTKRSKQLKK